MHLPGKGRGQKALFFLCLAYSATSTSEKKEISTVKISLPQTEAQS